MIRFGPASRPATDAGVSRADGLSAGWRRVVVLAPFFILGAPFALLYPKATRPAMLWLLAEDHPVEVATAVFLLAGGFVGLRLAAALRARRRKRWISVFYVAFSLGLFVVAMEEIAWGQRLLGFRTPEVLRTVNRQKETTLHNIGPLQGRSEWMRLVFGLGGLAGVALASQPAFAQVGVPRVLLSWFLLITGHAAIDAYNDVFPIEPQFDFIMQRTSEVVELLIAIASLLYVQLNFRRLIRSGGGAEGGPKTS